MGLETTGNHQSIASHHFGGEGAQFREQALEVRLQHAGATLRGRQSQRHRSPTHILGCNARRQAISMRASIMSQRSITNHVCVADVAQQPAERGAHTLGELTALLRTGRACSGVRVLRHGKLNAGQHRRANSRRVRLELLTHAHEPEKSIHSTC